MVACRLHAPLREMTGDVPGRKAKPLAVRRASLQLVGRDVGEPLFERFLLDRGDAALGRLLGVSSTDGE